MTRLLTICVPVAVLWAAHASAQTQTTDDEPVPLSSSTAQAEDTPPPQTAPMPGPTEQARELIPPAAPVVTIPVIELPFRLYGFIDPRAVFSSKAVESFSQSNASAITGAANPVLAFRPNEGRLTFQVQQSRVGLMLGEQKPVRGQLEFDFIDASFAKASPTTQAVPRLRIAKVEADLLDKHLLVIAGQDWDLFQPVNHPGLNLVGGAFTAGNAGFMRQQLKAIFLHGPWEAGFAVGLQVANAGAVDNNTELSRTPSFAVRFAYLPNAKSKIGVSGIASQLRFAAGAPDERRAFAGAAGVFGDISPSSWTNVRFEGYIGQNAQNLGLLTLSQGTAAHDISEFGGFVSIRQALGSTMHWVYGYGGIAHIMNDGVMQAGYTRNADGVATQTAGIYGIRQNITAHLGYELRPYDNLGIMLEAYWLRTHHKLLAADVGSFNGDAKAAGAELGMMYNF